MIQPRACTRLCAHRYSIYEFLRKSGASKEWLRILLATEGDLRGVNALAVTACFAPPYGEETQAYGLLGGNDQLPKAMAAALGERVRYHTPVLKLAPDEDGVSVTIRDATGQHEVRADHCVCTLPFPVLRGIEISPAFSDLKMRAIREYELAAIARVCFHTRTRFWLHDPLGRLGGLNMIVTDTPAERIRNMSQLQPDLTMGMLQSYFLDKTLWRSRASNQPRGSRIRRRAHIGLDRLSERSAGVRRALRSGDPAGRSGLTPCRPHLAPSLRCVNRRRIHFGGEHTSAWIRFQNDAGGSVERVARRRSSVRHSRLRTLDAAPSSEAIESS